MGCASSSLQDKPAVVLCHDRCSLLHDALRHSYALADAHLAYAHSLNSLAPSLHRFFHQISSDSHIRFTCDSDSDSQEEDRDERYEAFRQTCCNYQSPVISHGQDYVSSGFPNALAQPVYGASPPPPPDTSAWDFLNLFETFDRFETAPHILSCELKEGKENNGEKNHRKEKEKEFGGKGKKVKPEKVSVNNVVSSAAFRSQIESSGVSEVMREVQVQFEKGAESVNDVLKLLDVGRFRYDHKNSVYQVSLKGLHVASQVSMESKHLADDKFGSVFGGLDNGDELGINSGNLSATLKKLCMWEKKLYDQVKDEEKLRLIHEKKSRQLKYLDEKGAEAAHKVDVVRAFVRTIHTRRKIAFQVIDKLSITISKTRDEELWPWITKLIEGLFGMWKTMLECHRRQHQAVAEAKFLEAIACGVKLNDACLEVTMQLRFEIRNWILSFSNWIDVQRCYVKALNNWLLKCVLHEPEENADDTVSSPGRIVAPQVFVICDEWSQAMDRLSDKDVTEGMEGFFTIINQLIEHYNKETQDRVITTNKDMERKLKNLEREEQKLKKSQEKNRILLTRGRKGDPFSTVQLRHVTSTTNLHLSLQQILKAMESFAEKTVQDYDKLVVSIRDDPSNLKAP